jgi:thioredoxin 2
LSCTTGCQPVARSLENDLRLNQTIYLGARCTLAACSTFGMADKQLVRCSACGAQNRVDLEKVEQGNGPICGRCKQPLLIGSAPVKVTDATFATEVERSPVPVLLDLWAPWCGPCRMIAPVLEELAVEMAGRVRIAKLNVDENPVISSRFKVRSIPTLLIFQSGKEVDRMMGALPKTEIRQHLERAIAGGSSASRGH